MPSDKNKYPNNLVHYRRRMRLTQEQVAQLLGHRSRNALSSLESGVSLPKLRTALQLGIIYRVPVDFLYHDLYIAFREEIRERESNINQSRHELVGVSFP